MEGILVSDPLAERNTEVLPIRIDICSVRKQRLELLRLLSNLVQLPLSLILGVLLAGRFVERCFHTHQRRRRC